MKAYSDEIPVPGGINDIPSEKLYNLDHLYALVNNDRSFVLGLVKIFVTTIPKMVEEMKEACVNKNWEEVGKIAHKLKPTVETMRIKKIPEEVKFVESNIKELRNLNSITKIVENISNILLKVTEQLNEQFKKEF